MSIILKERKVEPKTIIKKNVSAIHINAKLSLLQRKLVNVLLYNAYDSLLTSDNHSVNVTLLCEMIGFDSKNIAYLKQALKGMVETSVEWDILEDDGSQTWEVASLLSSAKIRRGVCSYRYDKSLAEKLYHPDVYSKINLSVIKGMKSSYALILYENCYRFLNIGKTGWWDLSTFKKIMGVDNNGIYSQFKFLNRDLIKPAIKEVNHISNINLQYETKRKGRIINGIRFLVKLNPQLSLIEVEDEDEISQSKAYKQLMKMGVSKTLSRAWMVEYGEEYILNKIDYTIKQSSSGRIKSTKAGFLKSAIEKDFVSDEEIIKENKKEYKVKYEKREKLEYEIDEMQRKLRDIERKYRNKCSGIYHDAFNAMPEQQQQEIKENFAKSLSSIHKSDFYKNSWNSIISFRDMGVFWGKLGINTPTLADFAKSQGIEDIETYRKDANELQKELAT